MLRTHAVVEFGEPLQIVEQPLPLPMGEEVLVRTTYAGMCHSELHLWEGYFDTGGGNKLPLNTPRPHTLGHEIEGEVIEVNEALEENPELVNTSPYEDGWFFKLRVSDENLGSIDSLMTAEEYSSMLDGNS